MVRRDVDDAGVYIRVPEKEGRLTILAGADAPRLISSVAGQPVEMKLLIDARIWGMWSVVPKGEPVLAIDEKNNLYVRANEGGWRTATYAWVAGGMLTITHPEGSEELVQFYLKPGDPDQAVMVFFTEDDVRLVRLFRFRISGIKS
jgi:hypothetical protein